MHNSSFGIDHSTLGEFLFKNHWCKFSNVLQLMLKGKLCDLFTQCVGCMVNWPRNFCLIGRIDGDNRLVEYFCAIIKLEMGFRWFISL